VRGGSLNAGYYLYASQEELQKAMNSFTAEEKAALSKLPKSIQDMAIQAQAAALYGPAAGRQAALDKLSTLVSQAKSTLYNNTVGAYNDYRTSRSSNNTLNGIQAFQNTICSKSLEDARKTMGGITGSLTVDQQAFLDKLQSYLKNDEYVCKKSTNELIEELQRLTQQQVQQVMARMPTNDAAPQLNPFALPAASAAVTPSNPNEEYENCVTYVNSELTGKERTSKEITAERANQILSLSNLSGNVVKKCLDNLNIKVT
jgi:hypothetical protein